MFNKDDIIRIDFEQKYGKIKIEYVALYNNTKTTEQEALEAIETYGIGNNENVIIISKKQFENVFNS